MEGHVFRIYIYKFAKFTFICYIKNSIILKLHFGWTIFFVYLTMPAPNIYLLPKIILVGLIGLMKFNLHFTNGFFNRIITSFVKLKVLKPHVCWHKPQLQQHSITSLNNVAHQYLAFRIFLVVMFIAK